MNKFQVATKIWKIISRSTRLCALAILSFLSACSISTKSLDGSSAGSGSGGGGGGGGIVGAPGSPGAPTAVAAAAISEFQIGLVWQRADDNDTQITIERSLNSPNASWSQVATLPGRENAWQDWGAMTGISYQYRIKTSNSNGSSAYSPVASAKAFAFTSTLSPISGITLSSQTATTTTLNWPDPNPGTSSNGVTQVFVDVMRVGLTSFVPYGVAGAGAGPFTISELVPGAQYQARLRYDNSAVGYSDFATFSFTQPATTLPLPPQGLLVRTVGPTSLRLDWTNQDSTASVNVYRADAWNEFEPQYTPYVLVATLTAGTNTYIDTGLTSSNLYAYRLTAKNSAGESDQTTDRWWKTIANTSTGNGGRTLTVGPGKQYAKPSLIDWKSLGPGDVIQIYYQAQPYYDMWSIYSVGAYNNPIVVQGIPDPSTGALPVISGVNAVQAATDTGYAAGSGVISILRQGFGEVPVDINPSYIIIENLQIQDAFTPNQYTDLNGVTQSWAQGSSCIYGLRSHDVTIRNNIIKNCGNGVFAKSYSDWHNGAARWSFLNNHVYGNGNTDNGLLSHEFYIEVADEALFQGNVIGPNRAGAPGAGVKSRAIGTTVLANVIYDTGTPIQLSEAQDLGPTAYGESNFHTAVVANNLIHTNASDQVAPIWYGGDQYVQPSMRGGVLRVYYNTIVHRGSPLGSLINNSQGNGIMDFRGNLVFLQPVDGSAAPTFNLFRSSGYYPINGHTAYYGTNWFSPGSYPSYNNEPGDFAILGNSNLISPADDNPGVVNATEGDYRPASGSSLIGKMTANSLPMALTFNPYQQYSDPEQILARVPIAKASDLGAFQDGLDPNPLPPPPIDLAATFSFTPSSGKAPLLVNFTASVVGGTPPYQYVWTFGDGTTGPGATAAHTYSNLTLYSPTLTVTDASGNVVTSTSSSQIDARGYLQALRNTDAGFSDVGSWLTSGTTDILGNSFLVSNSGPANSSASWTFSGTTADSYGLWITEDVYHNYSSALELDVYDGSTLLNSYKINLATGDTMDPNLSGWVYVDTKTFAGTPQLVLRVGTGAGTAGSARIQTSGAFTATVPLANFP